MRWEGGDDDDDGEGREGLEPMSSQGVVGGEGAGWRIVDEEEGARLLSHVCGPTLPWWKWEGLKRARPRVSLSLMAAAARPNLVSSALSWSHSTMASTT